MGEQSVNILHLNSGLLYGGGLEGVIVDLVLKNDQVTNYLCIINDQWSPTYLNMLDPNSVLLCNRKIGDKNLFVNVNMIYKTYKFIRKHKIDIIHCHNSFALKVAYLIRKMLKVKVVYTIHDTQAYHKELNKYQVDKYIAISQSVFKTINKYVPKNRIELVYNGINLKRFSNLAEPIARNDHVIHISCVARIVPEIKGQDILIKALDVLKNQYKHEHFKCFFAGACYNQEIMDELNELVKQYNLQNHIVFMGNVENVETLYAATDVFVLPSRSEGFGLVIVEALAAGCSVVVSKIDGPLEIVKENEEYGLYFETENYKELAGKLDRLLSHADYKNSKNNKKTIEYLEREYSQERMIKRYNEVYSDVYQGNIGK
jgi:glycosyltransferase involved in cell wall biosynthesis